MTRRVDVAELGVNLAEYLRTAQSGETIQIFDGEQQVASIVPAGTYVDTTFIRRAAPGRAADVPLPPPLQLSVDILDLLREEKGDR